MNTLEDHCSHNYTGMPLESLAYDSTQWCPSGDPVLICIIGTFEHHWKATGRPLEAHWKHTGYQQLLLQWHSSVHWGLISRHTGLPLDCHWITTGSGYGGWPWILKDDLEKRSVTSAKQHEALCIILSSYVISNLSHGPEKFKLCFDLCDLDIWPLASTFCT